MTLPVALADLRDMVPAVVQDPDSSRLLLVRAALPALLRVLMPTALLVSLVSRIFADDVARG